MAGVGPACGVVMPLPVRQFWIPPYLDRLFHSFDGAIENSFSGFLERRNFRLQKRQCSFSCDSPFSRTSRPLQRGQNKFVMMKLSFIASFLSCSHHSRPTCGLPSRACCTRPAGWADTTRSDSCARPRHNRKPACTNDTSKLRISSFPPISLSKAR
jgi:hypothetical protein